MTTPSLKTNLDERERNRFILERLPAHLQTSFTEEQLSALRHSFTLIGRNRHRIDCRLSVPLPGRPFYFVLLAGPERRSKQRVAAAQRAFTIRAVVLLSMAVGSGLIVVLASLSGTGTNRLRGLWHTGNLSHPTVVPFKTNQSECEASGREWKNSECVDHSHGHTF